MIMYSIGTKVMNDENIVYIKPGSSSAKSICDTCSGLNVCELSDRKIPNKSKLTPVRVACSKEQISKYMLKGELKYEFKRYNNT